MTEEEQNNGPMVRVQSTRFGEFEVPEASLLEFPSGLIGFPGETKFVVVEHKPPFSWLHSTQNAGLAFVVVDGFEFGTNYEIKPPYGDSEIDLNEGDEFAMLIIVTVRPDPTMTTANLKAPVFVNLKNRKGVQIVLDDPKYSTRFPLWSGEGKDEAGEKKEESPETAGQKGESEK